MQTRAARAARSASRWRASAAAALALALPACGQPVADAAAPRGRGPLVAPRAEITVCELATYAGAATPLYSNRPYHTAQDVAPALGMQFCRGERHGTNVWTLEIRRPTTLVVFGHAAFGLEDRGWQPIDAPLEIAAAGFVFDRVYTRAFAPGTFVVRQGFHPTAPIVLWDPAAAGPAR